jgi:hypothetical protein
MPGARIPDYVLLFYDLEDGGFKPGILKAPPFHESGLFCFDGADSDTVEAWVLGIPAMGGHVPYSTSKLEFRQVCQEAAALGVKWVHLVTFVDGGGFVASSIAITDFSS